MPRLRVKSGRHFKGGVKYSPGEEFEGTLAEFNAFKDKLEIVEEQPKPEIDDSQLKVSIPSGKSKRRGRKRNSDNESDRSSDSSVD